MKINFVGDIGVFKQYEDLKIDPFEEVKLPESDLNVGNFEFIISNGRKKFFYDVQEKYSCSYNYLSKLKIGKFNALGLANNHVLDYGLEGALDTIEIFDKQNIQVFGFSKDAAYTLCNIEAKGIKIGIIACVKKGRWSKENFGFGPDTYSKTRICELIKNNKGSFDHIIVFPHWGTELVEIPELEDTENAKAFIESGASAVIGHHPHVSQGIEVYKHGLIAYSLGSFIYLSEDELGYSSKNANRHISICLNVEFSKEKILGFQAHYYNQVSKITELMDYEKVNNYAQFLNNNIYNRKLYNKQFVAVLLRRELRSFFIRFRKSPFKTILNYGKYILVKVFSFRRS